jgi:1-acyl-sn-glycerol-3-phosphate acyltransferase
MTTESSPSRRLTYDATRLAARLAAVLSYQIRCGGRQFVPPDGPALVCANHQSFLDPVLVGLACDRRLNYLARDTLFRWAPLRWLIQWYNAIPIQRDGFGLAGMKETMRRLKRGQAVLIFPEGTRTLDGQLRPIKPGITTLARRAKAPLVPAAIDGAFQAWPRQRRLPRTGCVWIQFGPVISADRVAALTDAEVQAALQSSLQACLGEARSRRQSLIGV